jgi:hypothetical protein
LNSNPNLIENVHNRLSCLIAEGITSTLSNPYSSL